MGGAGPALEGTRVRLRPPTREDHTLLYDWYNDPDRVAPYDRFSASSYEDLLGELAAAPGDPASLAARYIVERRSDGRSIGMVGHYTAHPVLSIVDVWYVLGDPAARGQGFGREAVGLLVTELFRTLTVERIGATCDDENVPSARLLEGLGFRQEGLLRSALFHHGGWHDVRVYGITRSEWAARSTRAGI